MIDEEKTFAEKGYRSTDLSHGSKKLVWAVCGGENCERKGGRGRWVMFLQYRKLCHLCAHKTEEIRRKISIANKCRTASDATKKLMSAAHKGKTHTEESKKLMSEAQKGKVVSDKTRALMRENHADFSGENNPMYGVALSDEQRKNISLRNMGKKLPPFTDDHKQKISASHQGIPHDEWEGFSTDKRYCEKFDSECKERNRDKYDRRCFLCDEHESENITKSGKIRKLSVHHIDMNKDQGCDGHEWYLVPLCMKCHAARSHSDLWQARIEYLLKEMY